LHSRVAHIDHWRSRASSAGGRAHRALAVARIERWHPRVARIAHHTRTGVFFANQYLVVGVMQARKKYGIKYPNLYAPPGHKNEEAFNCAQRAHQNTVESQALFLVELVIVGLFYPLFAATCGALYSVGRILYGYGYAKNGPDGRLIGSLISHLGDLPLQIAVFKLCYVAFTTW
jgi:glutathione S-transferase